MSELSVPESYSHDRVLFMVLPYIVLFIALVAVDILMDFIAILSLES